jgi:hypothetical protein
MNTETFDWTKYSLARINLVAQGRGGCPSVLPQVDEETLIRFREALKGNLNEDDRQMLELYDSLSSFDNGTFGAALRKYYSETGHSPVDAQGTFPVRYIMIHDAHHVLIGADTDEQGELDVLAFECGLTNGGQSAQSIIPLISQTKAFGGDFEAPRIGKYWEMGCRIRQPLLDTWDLGSYLGYPLPVLRQKYGIAVDG